VTTNVFDSVSNRRRLQEEEQEPVIEFDETSCLCPPNVDQQRPPTEAEFTQELKLALQDLTFVQALLEVQEVEPTLCDAEVVDFEEVFLVDVEVCDEGVLDEDVTGLEQAFVTAYNAIAEIFCDPHFRNIESATILRMGEKSQGNSMTLEMKAFGKCRGCDAETVSLYETSDMKEASSRLLLEDLLAKGNQVEDSPFVSRRRLDTCYCDTGATELRAPTEAEFIFFYQGFVRARQNKTLSCVTDVSECDFGDPFDTAIVASFANETSIDGYKEAMGRALLTTLINLYQNSEEVCNPEFRMYEAVESTIGIPFNPREFGFPVNRRNLQAEATPTTTPTKTPTTTPTASVIPSVSSQTTVTPSKRPSTSPTFRPSTRPTSTPSMLPTFIDTNTYVLLFAMGICNDCQDKTVLTAQGSNSSRALLPRFLQNTTLPATTSNCFCPIDSEKKAGPFLADAVQQAFQEQLAIEAVPLDLAHIYEVNVVECEKGTNAFDGNLVVEFSFNAVLTPAEFEELTQLVEDTYNILNNNYCDPFQREITTLRLSKSSRLSFTTPCAPHRVRFSASGICLGCVNGTSLLDEETQGRRALEALPTALMITSPPRRRRMAGSDVCFCDTTTIADRAPTSKEFEAALKAALEPTAILSKVCAVVVPEQNQETAAPTAAPTEKVCEVTLPDEFTTSVIVSVNLQALTDDQIDQLGASIQATYNSLNELTFTPCDLNYRNVTAVALDPSFSSRRLSDKIVSSSIESILLPVRVSSDGRGRRTIEDLSVSILFSVTVQCQGCAPETDLLDSSVISKGKFLQIYTRTVEKLFSVGVLEIFQEVDPISCPSEILEFSKVVIVELVQKTCLLGLNFTGDDAQLRLIQESFVATYNRLALDYCDPLFRTLGDAKIVRFGVNTTDGNLPLEIRVSGTCRDCDPDNLDIYALPTTLSTTRKLFDNHQLLNNPQRRHLQELEMCYCDAQPVGERPPFESEFVQAYQKSVQSLQLDCIETVGDCNFGTPFSTGIIVEFERDESLSLEEFTSQIEESFKNTINQLYSISEESCNPEFRQVQTVEATIGVNLTVSKNETRRLLGREIQDTSTAAPTPTPDTTSDNVTAAPTPVFGTAPTPLFITNTIGVLLYVNGVCNGCSSELTGRNQVDMGRLLESLPSPIPSRRLQDESFNATSDCFCPINATLKIGPVTSDEVSSGFQENLRVGNISLVVNEIDEVTVVQCLDVLEDFETTFIFSFAVQPDVTSSEMDDLANIIQATYNELNALYCDPLLRQIDTLFVSDVLRVRKDRRRLLEDCFNLDIEFFALGTCRGCANGVSLFGDDINDLRMRRALQDAISNKLRAARHNKRGPSLRRLQGSDFCICEDDAIATRAPTFEEFAEIFAEVLEAAFLPNVCGFFEVEEEDCDPSVTGEEFVTDVTLTLFVEGSLSGGDLSELEQEFFDTYNDVIDSLYDPCDPGYTQLYFISIEDIFEDFRRELQDESEGKTTTSGEIRSLQPSYVTITFELYGYCQSDCHGNSVSEVIGDVYNAFERIDFIIAVDPDGDDFPFFDTPFPSPSGSFFGSGSDFPEGSGSFPPGSDFPEGSGSFPPGSDFPEGSGSFPPGGNFPEGSGSSPPGSDFPEGSGSFPPGGNFPEGSGSSPPGSDFPEGSGSFPPGGNFPEGSGSFPPGSDFPEGSGSFPPGSDFPEGSGSFPPGSDFPEGSGSFPPGSDFPEGSGSFPGSDFPEGSGSFPPGS
jgi:hypothetical protein